MFELLLIPPPISATQRKVCFNSLAGLVSNFWRFIGHSRKIRIEEKAHCERKGNDTPNMMS